MKYITPSTKKGKLVSIGVPISGPLVTTQVNNPPANIGANVQWSNQQSTNKTKSLKFDCYEKPLG